MPPMINSGTQKHRDRQSSPETMARQISRRSALGVLGATALVHVAGCGTSSPTPHPARDAATAFHYLTLVDVARRIQSRDVSPVDLTERMLDRIAKVDPSLKSY